MLGGQPMLRIYGEIVRIRAEVVSIDGFSAQADADSLIRWMG